MNKQSLLLRNKQSLLLRNKIFWLPVAVLTFLIFRDWFGLGEIAAGDAGFYFSETLKNFPGFPYLWISDGLGSYSSLHYFFPYLVLPLKLLSWPGLPWVLIERIAWYGPFLVLGIFSSWFLAKTVLPAGKFRFLTPLIYLFNPYILMIVGGGQVSIFLPYAIAPLVLGLFIKKDLILAGVALAAQVMFEPRIALITMIAVIVYQLLNYLPCRQAGELRITNLIRNLGIPFAITGLLHFYWLLPTLVLRKESFEAILSSFGWVGFLSFANFSNSLSLLHPNWPENIFGKTSLMRPEFLILPILAYASLLFAKKDRRVLYFAGLGLIGAFLAKGSNPPLGEIYLWLFNHLPGMNLFRDASKFYLLITLSYSVLIPFSLEQISKKIPKASFLIPVSFLVFWLFLIQPAWLGELGGTFKAKAVPRDYFQLKDFLNSQDDFFRTFWIPQRQRFGFYSSSHPAIAAESFLTDTVCREPFCSLKTEMPEKWGRQCFPNDRCHVRELSYFLNPRTAGVLAQMAVKYVIIPFDTEGKLFVAEYQYNHQQREEVEEFLDTIPWLKKISVAEKIAVYQTPSHKDHFWIEGAGDLALAWQRVNPTKYIVRVSGAARPFNLVFSETYDELWQARTEGRMISSTRYHNFNSFSIDRAGDFEITVELRGQKYVYWGGVVSLAALLFALGYLIIGFRQVKT